MQNTTKRPDMVWKFKKAWKKSYTQTNIVNLYSKSITVNEFIKACNYLCLSKKSKNEWQSLLHPIKSSQWEYNMKQNVIKIQNGKIWLVSKYVFSDNKILCYINCGNKLKATHVIYYDTISKLFELWNLNMYTRIQNTNGELMHMDHHSHQIMFSI